MAKFEEMLDNVYDQLLGIFKDEKIYCQGKDDVNTIVLFDEPELVPGKKARFKIGHCTILILKEDIPFLSIEVISTEPTPPKTIAGLLPIHMITRAMVVNHNKGDSLKFNLDEYGNKMSLLIVVPDQTEVKEKQFEDLDMKFRGVLALNYPYSHVKNFAIAPLRNLENALSKLLNR